MSYNFFEEENVPYLYEEYKAMGFNELEEIITSSDKFSEDFKSKLKKLGQVAALSGAIMAGSMGLTGCPSPNQSNPLPQITSIEIVDEVPNSDAQITYDYQNGFSGKIKASFDIGEPTEININNGMVSNILGVEQAKSRLDDSKLLKEFYGLDREIYEEDDNTDFTVTINYSGKTTTAKVKNNISYGECSNTDDFEDHIAVPDEEGRLINTNGYTIFAVDPITEETYKDFELYTCSGGKGESGMGICINGDETLALGNLYFLLIK